MSQRLIGYIRVSTDEQRNSPKDQRKFMERYCEMFGHTLVDVIVELDVSGGSDLWSRAGGGILRTRLAKGEADGMLITEVDRAFRLTVDGLQTADWLQKRGLDIHTIYDRVDTSHPDGWMAFAHKLVAADWERRKIGYRTRRALRGKRARGEVYGQIPYGCREIDGKLFRDRTTWDVCERIVRDKAAGISYRDLAKQLHAEKIPAPGGKGRGGRAVGGKLWHVSTLKSIVDNHSEYKHYPFVPTTPETVVSGQGAA